MQRIKIDLPDSFQFSTIIPVRITDINYGGHVGNDSILSIIHEARLQFFKSFGFSEMDIGGAGTIMRDVAIEFKNESFYGDNLIVSVATGEFAKVGFDLFYKLEKESGGNKVLIAAAKTGIICYDYEKKKMTAIPEIAKQKFIERIKNSSSSSFLPPVS